MLYSTPTSLYRERLSVGHVPGWEKGPGPRIPSKHTSVSQRQAPLYEQASADRSRKDEVTIRTAAAAAPTLPLRASIKPLAKILDRATKPTDSSHYQCFLQGAMQRGARQGPDLLLTRAAEAMCPRTQLGTAAVPVFFCTVHWLRLFIIPPPTPVIAPVKKYPLAVKSRIKRVTARVQCTRPKAPFPRRTLPCTGVSPHADSLCFPRINTNRRYDCHRSIPVVSKPHSPQGANAFQRRRPACASLSLASALPARPLSPSRGLRYR